MVLLPRSKPSWHVFPLRGRSGGVLTRRGHTEGSIDLARLGGLKPAGVLCEVTNPDGTMASGIQVLAYAQTHDLTLITIEEPGSVPTDSQHIIFLLFVA